MSNTLGDLNTLLFEQARRLSADSMKGDKLKEEIGRAKAVTEIAGKITENANLVLKAQKFRDSKWDADSEVPKMLEG